MKTVRVMIAALALTAATAALAQRDPAYQAARSAGQVGEQVDGYLGVVGAGSAELRALVSNINIQRKSLYTRRAGSGATVEEVAFTAGCNLIQQTGPGEKYQTPGGGWATRGAGAPQLDSRCLGAN